MQIADIFAEVETLELRPATGEATGVEYDSRSVKPGSIFIAMRGETTDGNRYVQAAIAQGATGILTDSEATYRQCLANHNISVARIASGRRALAEASAAFFNHPEQHLKITAVTGTNGKTTTAFLAEALLQHAHRKTVLLGTIETHIAGGVKPSPHTTPESRDILEIFAQGVTAGATEAVMEMSSHALDQERVWKLPVDVAIFTNLTQDHLDYHQTMKRYAAAKARIFTGVGAPPPRVAIINIDDDYAVDMMTAAMDGECRQWHYSIKDKSAHFYAHDLQLQAGRTSFQLQTPYETAAVESNLTGEVNVYNLTAAIAAAIARGMSLEECLEAAKHIPPVPGRFQAVPNKLGIDVIVDYAHTDDALRNLAWLARCMTDGRVLTLFGCGGDRDRTKRPRMGLAAAQGSDYVVVTSDNPRSEDPQSIIDEIIPGIKQTSTPYLVEPDRHAAIARIINAANPGDTVLIAGKGHEKEQILNTGAIHFDDAAEAAAALRAREQQA